MIPKPNIQIGEKNTIQKKVEPEDTAAALGAGKLENLFSTPSLVAMMMEASLELVDSKLEDGFISVGLMAGVTHEKTTILDETVSVEVEVVKFDGTTIEFKMIAFDEVGVIAHGHHHRMIVNKNKLFEKAHARATSLESQDF